jgi:hypothetical protein
MRVSLYLLRGARKPELEPIDKSNHGLFKPSALDVIFHECKIETKSGGKFHAFAR